MSDKEKLLIGVIVVLLGSVLTYRIAFVDIQLTILEDRINKIIEDK